MVSECLTLSLNFTINDMILDMVNDYAKIY